MISSGRYFNVIGSDAKGRIGEWANHPVARENPRISAVCFEVALGLRPTMTINGDDFPTADGTCVRDYVHVSDVVKAHVKSKAFFVECCFVWFPFHLFIPVALPINPWLRFILL
jgi:UDP-glucose 4-epimerase